MGIKMSQTWVISCDQGGCGSSASTTAADMETAGAMFERYGWQKVNGLWYCAAHAEKGLPTAN